MKAKKQFGQHFLKSESALKKIIEAGMLTETDTVLEIGPGTGILTEKLLASAGKVIAIEKDRDLVPLLKEKFAVEILAGKLLIIERDVLDFDPGNELSLTAPYKLIANIPYYITGAILEKFLSATMEPEQAVLLIQKEVAERIIARDGKESILSLSVKVYGTPKIIAKVPAGAFSPPPKVDSAILSIKNISREFFKEISEALFFDVIKTAFGQKRKTIGKTLREKYGEMATHALAATGIDPRCRPEDITLSAWKILCLHLAGK